MVFCPMTDTSALRTPVLGIWKPQLDTGLDAGNW